MLSHERLELGKKGIGGSEIGAICGLSRYKNPQDIWETKVYPERRAELEKDLETNHNIERGLFGEPMLRNWLSHRLGVTVEPGTLLHYEAGGYEHIASPDGYIYNGNGELSAVVELKFPGWRAARDYVVDGELCPPPDHIAQVQWELMAAAKTLKCGGDLVGVYAAYIDGDLHYTHIKPDLELQGLLRAKATEFWSYVNSKAIPPTESAPNADALSHFLDRAYPKSKGMDVVNDKEKLELAHSLINLRAQYKALVEDLDKAENKVKAAMGDTEVWDCGNAVISWKTGKERTFVDYAAAWDKAKGLLGDKADSIIAECTEKKLGSKYFRIQL